MTIRAQADRGSQIGREDAQSIERRLFDRRHAGVRGMAGVTEMALIDRRAAAECRIVSGTGMLVIAIYRRLQRGWLDADRPASASTLLRLDQLAASDETVMRRLNGWIRPSP